MTAAAERRCVICASSGVPVRNHLTPDLATDTCPECGFVTGIFRVRQNISDYERIDMEQYQASIGRMRREEAPDHVRLLDRYAPHPRSWFDIGSGIGSILIEAQRRQYVVGGAEPDAAARRLASAAMADVQLVEWFDEASVPDGSQGVISMLDVLEHLPPEELSPMARLVRSKLAPGGYWLLKVPSTDGLFYTVANLAQRVVPRIARPALRRLWLTQNVSPHHVYFREATLLRFLRDHGFVAVEIRYTPAIPNGTIRSRLSVDSTIPRSARMFMTPLIAALNLIEHLRNKSDSLLVLARKADS